MKRIMWKYFTANNTNKYIDELQNMVNKYNTTYHRSYKLTPSEASVFNSQEMLQSPLIAIEKYSGVRYGEIRADFYDDCQNIPDPSALDRTTQKNLKLLGDCFLGKQNKAEAYYTLGRHNNCDTIYIAQNYFHLPRHTIRENSNFIILFPQDTKNLTHIHADHCAGEIPLLEFKQFCHRVWSEEHNFVTIDLTSTPTNGKYRQNFNRFYFPTGCMDRQGNCKL